MSFEKCNWNVRFVLALFAIAAFLGRVVQSFVLWDEPKSPITISIDSKAVHQGFKVYWNSPTMQCHKYGLTFDHITTNYGIINNNGGSFRGNHISILYDPGKFPALLEQKDGSGLFKRNGGVPQEGSLQEHLREFKTQLEELIPDGAFNGIGIIDFESWRPIFRQNFGKLKPYKKYSYDIERKNHPLWPTAWVENEASRRFEASAVDYMKETLKAVKEARPLAKWGFYAYPYCFNMNGDNKRPNCPDNVVDENNRIQWLWDESDALYPSVYMGKNKLNADERLKLVKGRVFEARRIASRTNLNPSIYPYIWYKYQDSNKEFLTKEDLYNAIKHMKNSNLNGVIIWGSSNDVNSRENCLMLDQYVKNVLGPVVREINLLRSQRSFSNSTEEETLSEDYEIPELVKM